MKTYTAAAAALLLASGAFAVTGTEQPATQPQLDAPTVQGCFSSGGELVLNSTQKYNTIGKCATEICYAMGKSVGGSTRGNQCYCGDKYPPKSTLVDDSKCTVGCPGFGTEACGGDKYFTIYNTGVMLDVEYSEDTSSSTSSSSSLGATPSVATQQNGETVVVTATNTPASDSKSSGSNTGAVAGGVVAAVLVVAAIAGGAFFYIRRRRNREIEEEHRRNAAVNAFISGSKPPGSSGGSSITDSRLDPVMAQRRMSSGSIADNQDYSRRILRVTNA